LAQPGNTFNKRAWDMLPNELKVAVKIEKLRDESTIPYYSILAKDLENEMSSSSVHIALDRLIDRGTIDADWTKVGTKWVRGFRIKMGEDQKFIQNLRREIFASGQ
jgi:hypothetical protein